MEASTLEVLVQLSPFATGGILVSTLLLGLVRSPILAAGAQLGQFLFVGAAIAHTLHPRVGLAVAITGGCVALGALLSAPPHTVQPPHPLVLLWRLMGGAILLIAAWALGDTLPVVGSSRETVRLALAIALLALFVLGDNRRMTPFALPSLPIAAAMVIADGGGLARPIPPEESIHMIGQLAILSLALGLASGVIVRLAGRASPR